MKRLMAFGMAVILGLTLVNVWSGNAIADENKTYNEYLIKALKDSNEGIRSSAAMLLGERKCKQAIEPLKKMMKKDKFYASRIVAALALYEIGDKSVIGDIKKIALSDRNRTVRHVLAGIVHDSREQYLVKM